MKKLILSWASTILFILFGLTQQAQAQCVASDKCFDFKFIGVERVNEDFVRLSFSIKTNCDKDLSYAAFELPNDNGVTSNANNYSSKNYKYSVENGTYNPFWSVKFEGVGINGYKNGAEDIFTYEMSAFEYSTMRTLQVAAKAGTTVGTVTFDLAKCGSTTGGGSTDGGNTDGNTGGNNGGGNNNGNNGGGNGGGNNQTDKGNCSTSQPSPISGPYAPCPGEIVTYCIDANPKYTSYVWDVPRAHAGEAPSGWEIISGQGTNCVTVRVGQKPGTMKVKVTHSECGTKVRTKPVHPGRLPEVEIVGPGRYCPDESLTYKAVVSKFGPGNNGNGGNDKFLNYVWTVPADWKIVSGQGTKQIVVIAGQTTGDISVKVTSDKDSGKDTSENGNNTDGNPNNGNGNTGNNQAGGGKYCGPATATITPERKPECGPCPEGALEVALIAPDTVCNLSDDTYRFEVAEVQDGVTYEFQLPEGFIVVDEGNGYVEVVAIFEEEQLGQPQTVTVIARNECGEATASEQVVVVECAPGNPLPVSLTRFDGVSRNGAVELEWSTATEINNDRFEIERSYDGKTFTKIGEVKGAGNATVNIDYAYSDRQANQGTVYYRLRQVDFDGSFEHSKVIAVNHSGSATAGGATTVSVFPNPVTNGQVNIRFAEAPKGNVMVRLIDLSGRVLHTKNLGGGAPEVAMELQSLGLAKGIYMISITNGGKTDTQRLMIR
ncbi:T9SS type A sorting domain-containing protein [Rufibacter roseus]|uniref:T9SS type A sorting domain-containing protein n=1 Tax=Rufibacter roseus TaxID=1567108 RepID=A0ABW2DMN3_9BACT|nr:T9SS type A sorting domain-containing protein [Rufibacter roseus]